MAETRPAFHSPIHESLASLHEGIAPVTEGQVATYIPELAKANPDWFGICLVTAHGTIYEVGDTSVPFTIQSISKPFVYGMALEDNGRASVLGKIGVEPTGDAFNSISLEPGSGRPRNPMINAGAIATTGLVAASCPKHRETRILQALGAHAGRELTFDEEVYRSESQTGHRNRAIGHMLRNFGILESDPMPVVESYFRQCSATVTCRDLGVMAATLANRGVNPITGKQALRGEYVESVLSVMETCGMYDSAGRWVYDIGMPAKSGVAGGVIAVLPGQLGIGVFSPRLDAQGNSVRGIRVCSDLSRYLDLHLLNRPAVGRLAVRRHMSGAAFNSNRVRLREERARLAASQDAIQLYQLQGNLAFTTTESVVSDILSRTQGLQYLILDFKRALSVNESACYLFHQLFLQLSERGVSVAITQTRSVPLVWRYLRRKHPGGLPPFLHEFPDPDRALEWAENGYLRTDTLPHPPISAENIDRIDLFQNLGALDLARIADCLKTRPFQKGEILVEIGAAADEMFVVAAGLVSVVIPGSDGSTKRLASLGAGMTFGDMALLDRAPRSARVVAETDGTCLVLGRGDFDRFENEHPQVMLGILRNMGLALSARLRKANTELALLD